MQRIEDLRKKNLLNVIFEKGLSDGGSPATYFFDTIYAPIRLPTASGMPATDTYIPVGWSYSEIASIYGNKFGGNFWPQYFADLAALNTAISNYECMAVDRMIDCIAEHKYKYKKLIELQGYAWNPLWNVDGTVLRSHVEQHAAEEESTATDTTSTVSRTPYDSATWKDAEKQHSTGTAANNVRKTTHTQDPHSIAATDNAFGEALTGSDIYHAEKEVRTGNIGVTKTTELIESARKTLAYSLLNVFFEDLNQNLLIGLF